jgi:hypothetical protein
MEAAGEPFGGLRARWDQQQSEQTVAVQQPEHVVSVQTTVLVMPPATRCRRLSSMMPRVSRLKVSFLGVLFMTGSFRFTSRGLPCPRNHEVRVSEL